MGYPMAWQAGSPDWKFHRVMWSRGMVFAKENGVGQTGTKRKGAKQMISEILIEGSWGFMAFGSEEFGESYMSPKCM